MESFSGLFNAAKSLFPAGIVLVVVIGVIILAKHFLEKRYTTATGRRYQMQLIMIALYFIALLIVLLVLPFSDTTRGQLLGLIGILLSAAIALSSTTFVGNAMAGMMLRAVRSFRLGDFIRVGDHFGKVSERGLFHVEIQTEDRDLTTLPNLYLVTNPVKVVRASGTVVTATVSLGYDIPRSRVEPLLLEAAKEAELQEPFTHITELGNFSVTYRIAGLLTEIKQIITARSQLHCKILDKLHENGIEIVSPTFMNTRTFPQDVEFIPEKPREAVKPDKPSVEELPENILFDKADQAETLEKMQSIYDSIGQQLKSLKDEMQHAKEDEVKQRLQSEIDKLEERRKRIESFLRTDEKK
jgi:small-conductance mechanosensitive channel